MSRPATAPTSSTGTVLLSDRTIGTPARAAARAMANSPSRCTMRWPAIGAIANGRAQSRPNNDHDVATAETSTNERGTIRQRSSARRFSARVSPDAAPSVT